MIVSGTLFFPSIRVITQLLFTFSVIFESFIFCSTMGVVLNFELIISGEEFDPHIISVLWLMRSYFSGHCNNFVLLLLLYSTTTLLCCSISWPSFVCFTHFPFLSLACSHSRVQWKFPQKSDWYSKAIKMARLMSNVIHHKWFIW